MNLPACVFGLATLAAAAAAEPIDLRRIEPVVGDTQAGKDKAAVCAACHGENGVSPVPMFPNLAGQSAEYTYWRLLTFKRAGRPDSPMTPLVATLDDTAMRDLAAYYAGLAMPDTTSPAAGDTAARARRVYHEGDPASGTPPCQGCHGTDARGHPEAVHDPRWRVYPALRGQHATYIEQRLAALAADREPATTTAHVMGPVARTLDPATIAALAAWLESGAP